jgi:outer membrane protein OmpA-like peptidoglycan-associated protein
MAAFFTLAWLLALPGAAQTLPEGAERLGQRIASPGQVLVATGPWTKTQGLAFVQVSGAVTTEGWQMPDGGQSTLQLANRLQDDLKAAGYSITYTCTEFDCGGFDFRFAIPTLPEPEMHVDLGNFIYVAAKKPGPNGDGYRLLLISRGPGRFNVQITTVQPAGAAEAAQDAEIAPKQEATMAPDPMLALTTAGALVATLVAQGSAPLDDLVFAPGSAELEAGDYASLEELGAWLAQNPSVAVALVGHTDTTGGLAGNIVLSKGRADSVLRRIQSRFNVPTSQIVAEGVGYLAPRAPNDTPEGQAKNRRVEVVVTSTR